MIRDPGRVTDGFASLERGADSGRNPSLLPRNQVAWAENSIFRGGYWMPRPGWKRLALLSASQSTDYTVAFAQGKFQGASFFDDVASRKGLLIAQTGGHLYRIEITNGGAVVMDITPTGDPSSSTIPQVWMQQAENYLVVQDGQSRPFIFDGSTTRRAEDDEVPVGSGPMAYGMLRLWVAMGKSYVAGDVAGGTTGVLKFTENDYIAEGGEFSLPMSAGNITAMQFTATPNTALGQGELLIFTPDAVFSNTAPVDRDAWKNLVQPIQTITLINNGAQSQNSTALVNGDVFMRSRDGIRSVIQAVRYFQQWGNTPLSNELARVLPKDDPTLLKYVSAVEFDNRLLMTCQPVPLTNGCYFTGVASLDFEPVTSMGDKLPPAYDGVWTGRQVYQLVKGRFGGVERCFAFCRSETDGFLSSVLLVNGGSGFVLAPTALVIGGGGSGATLQVSMCISAISSIAAAGSAYAVNDKLTISGIGYGAYVQVTSVNATGGVTGVVLINGGSDPSVPSNPLATTLDTAIHTVRLAIISGGGGSGYVAGDTLTVVGGTGTAATFVVATTGGGGSVTGVTLATPGDYTVLPTNPVATTTSGGGTGCQLQLYFGGSGCTLNATWSVKSVAVLTPGSGYTSRPTIEFNTGNASAVAVVDYRMELWELTRDGKFDYDLDDDDNPVEERIEWFMESPSYGFNDGSNAAQMKRLETADLWIDRVSGTVDFTMRYRPDQYPCWNPWHVWQACATKCIELDTAGCVVRAMEEQYRPRQVLPQPPELTNSGLENADSVVAKSMRTGYEFSVRLNVVGFCRIKLLRLHAKQVLETVAQPVAATTETCSELVCDC